MRITHLNAAMLLFLATSAAILTVLGFQHIGGYIPCKLCLEQREPYYLAIPVAALAVILAYRGVPAWLTRALIAIVGLLLLWTMALGIYHSGVEWAWWPGPTDCGGPLAGPSKSAGDLFDSLARTHPPSCAEAAGRFLGLSFAGWNVLASLGMAVFAFVAAARRDWN